MKRRTVLAGALALLPVASTAASSFILPLKSNPVELEEVTYTLHKYVSGTQIQVAIKIKATKKVLEDISQFNFDIGYANNNNNIVLTNSIAFNYICVFVNFADRTVGNILFTTTNKLESIGSLSADLSVDLSSFPDKAGPLDLINNMKENSPTLISYVNGKNYV